jgi:hypothetical protein
MKLEHKRALRCFILEKLGEVTCLQLAELAETHDCCPFSMAEQFDIEFERIAKLFNYPNYSDEE